ncbi:MAG: lysophospholipid acyltransferase family protein [Anaerolineaceae bacterium]|nr:lysophospholipid acyltransferase family protein [Anaerolineaceae bacterium]
MKLRDFLQDGAAVSLGLWLGRILPLQKGRRLALKVGAFLSKSKSNPMRSGILVNQAIVSEGKLSSSELEILCKQTCQSIILSLFDYFYFFRHPEQLHGVYTLSPEAEILLTEIQNPTEPMLFLGPHLGNFDLLGFILSQLGMKALVLSAPSPNGAYKAQNELRQADGLRVMPMSLQAYREARKVLSKNGSIITGVDRPSDDPHLKRRPLFFNRPSLLPVFYEKLAIDSAAKVRIGATLRKEDGTYHLLVSKPIYFSKEDEDNGGNIKKVTDIIEAWIREYQSQWAIFKPIWPEAAQKNKE